MQTPESGLAPASAQGYAWSKVGTVMKRQLSDAEKVAIVERQRALILASRPNVLVSIHVEDETDANGDPITQITIQENKNDDGSSSPT